MTPSSVAFIRLFFLAMVLAACRQERPVFEAPLLQNIGRYSVDITSGSPYTKQFFNQGLIMANAFNHGEAVRSFREAVRLDSTCAMAWWGIAYVLGPNYNTSSNLGETREIQNAVAKATMFSNKCKGWEQALITAIGRKFPDNGKEPDEQAYADAMNEAFKSFPENDLVITLQAESMMNMHAWDLYSRKGGEARPWTAEIVSTLEKALKINPENPLANHLYLHATEAAPDVGKALMSAERLKTLVPAAGHLVHMPSHIYINTGDYHEGSIANERAVVADSIYIAECKVQGIYPQLYYPHNYHFLSATAALEGRGARSIEAAYKTASIVDPRYFLEPGYETVLHYITIPNHVLVKFSQWEKILAQQKPDEKLTYPTAIWHYARGMAFANTGKLSSAEKELKHLVELKETDAVKNLMIWEINAASNICDIAELVLKAEIALKEGEAEKAIAYLKGAVIIEDQLNYNEPPDWFFSVRHHLGEVYMDEGRYAEAETIYREDLTYWVKNGYALNGLYQSLAMQKKDKEAEEIKRQFEEAWKHSDSKLKYSRLDASERKNLALRIDKDSPDNLIYVADVICMK